MFSMESDQILSKKASEQFISEDYDTCVKTLQVLSDSRPKDTRIQLNKLVTEFYQSGFCKTDELRKGLANLKRQYELSDRHSGEELDDIALSCLLYNEAVVHFHLHQPNTAINLLERLFKIIEPLDDSLAIKVSYLLVELYLVTFEIDQANGMMNFIKTTLLTAKGGQGDKDNSRGMEDYKIRLLKFKARALLLRSSLKECKRELKNIMNSDSSAAEALFLKSNYEFCRQNYPKSIRLLETALKTPHSRSIGHSIPTMFHNDMSCVYFHMSKFNMAILHSKKALDENNSAMRNLPPFEKAHQLSGRPIQTLGMNRRHDILYNVGIQLLFAGQGSQAFDCLIEAHKTFYCNPTFWLRLAECCISVRQLALKTERESSVNQNELTRKVLQSSQSSKIILPSVTEKYIIGNSQATNSSVMPSATLEFATICLQNIALLLPSVNEMDRAVLAVDVEDQEKGNATKSTQNHNIKLPIGTDKPLETEAIHSLRISLLACQAYVAMEISDYHNALNYGRQLLSLPKLPGVHKFLGHLYVAEALIKLNKITEATKELSPQLVSDFACGSEDDKMAITSVSRHQLFPTSLHEAKVVMLINLACAQCIQSDYEKAKRTLQQVARSKRTQSATNQLLLLSIYVELKTGNTSQALSIIKRGSLLSADDIMDRFENEAVSKYPNVSYAVEAQ